MGHTSPCASEEQNPNLSTYKTFVIINHNEIMKAQLETPSP